MGFRVIQEGLAMKYNINQYVKVKLTDYGMDILKKDHDELQMWMPEDARRPFEEPKLKDGWYKTQLWILMNSFGSHLSMGGKLPFETEIHLEEPND